MSSVCQIRVPKTGSTWLASQLLSYGRFSGEEVCGTNHQSAEVLSLHPHEHRFFTTIRNPFQSAISFYMMGQRMKVMAKNMGPDKVPPAFLNGTGPLSDQPHNKDTMDLIRDDTVTVEQYVDQCPPNQLFYFYYNGTNPLTYEYVGDMADWERSQFLLWKILEFPVVVSAEWNVNPDKEVSDSYAINYSEADFIARNSLDYEMYEFAKERHSQLLSIHGV